MIPTNSAPQPALDVHRFASQIQQRCRDVVTRQLDRYHGKTPHADFSKIITPYVTEGKTLRALGVSVGAAVASEVAIGKDSVALELGVALELYQGSALIHDDLIDQAPRRRGQPSAHRRAVTLLGEQLAAPVAILAGDYLLSLVHVQAAETIKELPREVGARVSHYLADITAEVAWGQYLDVLASDASLTDPRTLRRQLLEVIAVKAGNYSVMRPLLLGALIHRDDEALLTPLRTAGHNWGLAFQLRDDALDFSASATGKTAGTDLREGKRTILLTLTLERATDRQREIVTAALGQSDLTPERVTQVHEIMHECGAWDEHEALIEQLYLQGLEATDSPALTSQAQQLLGEYAQLLVRRQS